MTLVMAEATIFNEDCIMKKYISLLAAFAVLFSCVEKEPEQVLDDQEAPVENIVSIFANAPAPHSEAGEDESSSSQPQQSQATRTQLVDGKKVMWSPGDVVKVCFEPKAYVSHKDATRYGCSSLLSYNATEVSPSAVFSGFWSPADPNKLTSYGVVVYPGNSDNFKFSSVMSNNANTPSTTISYELPTEQEAIEGTFAKDLNLSYSLINLSDMSNNTASIQFKNLCSVFCINMPSTEYNVKSIKLEVDNNTNNTYMTGLSNLQLSSSVLKETEAASSSKPTYVILNKADGSDLTPGASYYAVVWAHNYRGVKLTFTNAAGKECVKTASKDAWIMCAAGKKYNFNISSLSFTEAPYLDVLKESLTVNAKGDITESFTVTANNSVTVSTDAAWLSASYADGKCTVTAQKNNTSGTRTATITINSSDLTKTVKVSQEPVYYSISGSALTKASDLADGQMYVARRQASSNEYWTVNSSGTLVLGTVSNTSSFTGNQVFIFNKDNSQAAGVSCGSGYSDKYSYMSAGAWQSVWNDQYLNHSFYLGSTKYYFSMYSGWKQNSYSQKTGEDFDIYKANDTNMFNWTGSYFNWGNSGTDKYKWTFYKVVEN